MNISNSTAVVRACAKVNLTLDVLGKRADGYHDIESVMQTISLHDTVTLQVGGKPGIRVSCDVPGIPTDKRNLAYKAAEVFFEDLGTTPRADIHIEKRIPIQAGLGGGSSNAAAVLTGLASAEASASAGQPENLSRLAAAIGSDVPFFLVGGTAFVWGRGEHVLSLPDIPASWLTIVKPPFGVSTPWAYNRLDEIRPTPGERPSASERMVECVESGDENCLPSVLSNDLEPPVIEQHPGIQEIKDLLVGAGARSALMCGSGSAVFGLFGSEEDAGAAARTFAGRDVRAYVVKTLGRIHGSSNEGHR